MTVVEVEVVVEEEEEEEEEGVVMVVEVEKVVVEEEETTVKMRLAYGYHLPGYTDTINLHQHRKQSSVLFTHNVSVYILMVRARTTFQWSAVHISSSQFVHPLEHTVHPHPLCTLVLCEFTVHT